VVVGQSETAAGTFEAFLWTRGGGMRGLGTLGGNSAFASSVNTHRRVVGGSNRLAFGFDLPFLWTPAGGMRRLPTLGGDSGDALYLNEFGQIVGTTITAQGAERATLWTPTAGPLVLAPKDGDAAPEARTR
jgi:probable HAF family extracellular repeat protein